MEEEGQKHRVQFNFSDEAFRELEKLIEKTGLPNLAEVVREALGLFRHVVSLFEEGGELLARRGEDVREIVPNYIQEKDAEFTDLDRQLLKEHERGLE